MHTPNTMFFYSRPLVRAVNRAIKQGWIFCHFLIFVQNQPSRADTSKQMTKLEYPSDNRVAITPERNVTAVFRNSEGVYLLAHMRNTLVFLPFKMDGKSSEEVFGTFTETRRTEINKRLQEVAWRGISAFHKNLVVLDGLSPALVLLSQVKNSGLFEEVMFHNLPRDLLKPPRDRIGEPGRPETEKLRSKFSANYARLGTVPKFSGLTQLNGNIDRDMPIEFLLASRVLGFPLLKIGCKEEGVKSCRMTRSCWLHGLRGFEGNAVTGVAYSEKRKQVLMGDSKLNKIHVFSGQHCHSLQLKRSIDLPKEVKEISNIFVDANDFLWLTTSSPDLKKDASLYVFESW